MEMQLQILKHIVGLLKRRKYIAIWTTGTKGRGILKELMDDHIKQFPWLTIYMISHNNISYSEEYALTMLIDTHQQNVESDITNSSPVNSAWLRNDVAPMAATPSGTILTASETPTEADDSQGTSKRGGRPKGGS
jgi:hypothetical protein